MKEDKVYSEFYAVINKEADHLMDHGYINSLTFERFVTYNDITLISLIYDDKEKHFPVYYDPDGTPLELDEKCQLSIINEDGNLVVTIRNPNIPNVFIRKENIQCIHYQNYGWQEFLIFGIRLFLQPCLPKI
jgi:hypothetical protein